MKIKKILLKIPIIFLKQYHSTAHFCIVHQNENYLLDSLFVIKGNKKDLMGFKRSERSIKYIIVHMHNVHILMDNLCYNI